MGWGGCQRPTVRCVCVCGISWQLGVEEERIKKKDKGKVLGEGRREQEREDGAVDRWK